MKNSKFLPGEATSLLEAIKEGKQNYKNMPRCGDEDIRIKHAIAAYLWNEFRGIDVSKEILDVLIKITK